MGMYIEPVLNEEQMAAYLDGMLTDAETQTVELLINDNQVLTDILNAIDAIDAAYIENAGGEAPLECMADDFVLPEVDGGDFMSAEDDCDQIDFTGNENDDDSDLCTDDNFDDIDF